MHHLQRIAELRQTVGAGRQAGQRIAVVPTMGNLHAGHIHLVEQARRYGDIVVCTIFVNPMQFGRNEDLGSYPRTLAADMDKLRAAGCDVLFAPP
ncbi:MAG: pantoate--beta-alanine ligase, partial [Pseudomonas sp.]